MQSDWLIKFRAISITVLGSGGGGFSFLSLDDEFYLIDFDLFSVFS